eukprot:TRINITY_DN4572_c0_g2_i1.p1 TRINITY_DN4572_c0_g2~~TRINITY_DN4572_c0_g2_i1.p1  ORF type:complete len:311 (-),score=42.47 TRINITY_DN4572_c0_g2_i1:76-1008(-)
MQSPNLPTVHCKVVFCEEIRRFYLVAPTFAELIRTLTAILQISPSDRIILKYKDDEEDLVTLSSDIEFETAITLLKPNDLLRLFVTLEQNCSRPVFTDKKCRKIRKEIIRERKDTLRREFKAQFEPRKIVVPLFSPEDEVPLNINSIVKNVGERQWPIGTVIALVNKSNRTGVLEKFSILEPVAPGSFVPFSITMKAPMRDINKLKWKVQLPNGTRFGKFVLKTRAPCSDSDIRKKKHRRSGCGRFNGQRPGCAQRPVWQASCKGLFFREWAHKIVLLKEIGFQGPSICKTLKECAGDVELAAAILVSQQ